MDATVARPIDAGRPISPSDAGGVPGTDATPERPPYFADAAAEPLAPTSLSAGGEHTCAVTVGGGVRCWGENESDQLGPTSVERSATAVAVPIEHVTSVSAGSRHTCALLADGRVLCWGHDHSAQLGRGEDSWHMGRGSYPVPEPVLELDDVRSVSSGGGHSCAITLDDRVLCWGGNHNLQAGRAVGTVVTSPYWIRTLEDVLSIFAGPGISCAIHASGGLTCWGDDRLGLFATPTGRGATAPIAIPDVEDAVQVACDGPWPSDLSCVLHRDATVTCCPVTDGHGVWPGCATVSDLTGVTQISAAGGVACALLLDGSVWCWGWNNYGLLGRDHVDFVGRPTPIAGPHDVTEISVGGTHACIRAASGEVRCWGDNSNGQVGAGSLGGTYYEPVSVVGL